MEGLASIRCDKECAVVIVTGARMTTLCRRLPFLPACDAVAAEGGGRLFWTSRTFPKAEGAEAGLPPPGSSSPVPPPTLCDLREDMAWRMRHAAAAGTPSANEGVPPREREGVLWDAFRRLEAEGWAPDASGYSTSFRLPLPKVDAEEGGGKCGRGNGSGKTERDLDLALRSLPPCLSSSRNLGCADVFPSTSGKEAVGRHAAAALGVPLSDCAFLCDDDNDLPLAAAVGRAFVVGATHPSVARAIAAEGGTKGEKEGHFWTTGLEGTLAADAAVKAAGAHLREVLSRRRGEEEGNVAAEQPERAPAFA